MIIRLATLGALVGFLLVSMYLPSWRPENRVPYALILFGLPLALGAIAGAMIGRLRRR